jgi:hypothetical protein
VSANIRVLGRPQPVFDQAILTNAMVVTAGFATRNSNINFPCLTEPPSWALGLTATAPVWLFFSDHNGREIRAAHAATIETTSWTVVGAADDICTSLSLAAMRLVTALDEATYNNSDNHFSSPCVIWDDAAEVGYMYIHCEIVDGANNGWRHGGGLAVSGVDLSEFRAAMIAKGHDSTLVNTYVTNVPANDVGRVWRCLPEQLGAGETGNPTYFRVWKKGADWHCVSNQGDLRRCEISAGTADPLGCSKFRSLATPNNFTNPLIDGVAILRHCEMYPFSDGNWGWMLSSRAREADVDPTIPEHIRVALIDMRDASWQNWVPVTLDAGADTPANVTLRRPMRSWEGTGIAIVASPTAISGPQQILLDPHVYRSRSGRVYFLCAAKGEQGIGLYFWNEAA